jgi:transposase
MKIATVGLDIAKQVFQVHAADSEGRAVLRRRLQRNQVAEFFANLPPCLVGLEACCGSRF